MFKLYLTDQQKFDALVSRFEDQTEHIRTLTKVDLQVFGGYITLQLALSSWLTQHSVSQLVPQIGLGLVDLALSIIAGVLLYNNFRRRKEVVQTLTNIKTALGFYEPGVYLKERPLDPETLFRPWTRYYLVGVIVSFLGFLMVLFGKV